MFPAPNFGFLALASTATVCAVHIIRTWSSDYVTKLTSRGGPYSGFGTIFHKVNYILSMGAGILLPIFARYVGQRVGIEVPGYLQTVGYVTLTNGAFAIAKNTYDILKEVYTSKLATD
jgi:hypothetical protein